MDYVSTVNKQEPWYRNPWVCLLIAIPTLTVIGCMVTIYLAITNPHILVKDNASDRPPAIAGNVDTGRD